jgi:hypothetical protein
VLGKPKTCASIRTALSLGISAFGLSVFQGALLSSPFAYASPDQDRKFGLEVIGVLRASDNVDGLFGDLVRDAVVDLLQTRYPGRFTVQDLRKADELFQDSKIPYFKVIEDRTILEKLNKQLRLESLIRTRVFKEGPRYRFVMEWLHSPRADLMATETFALTEPKEGLQGGLRDLQPQIQAGVERLIRKVPFYGQVTGHEEGVLTVNIGALNRVKRGDIVVLGTLEEARRHPVLGQVVDWRFQETGKAVIETVDEGISFARVIEEVEGRQVSKHQKIIRILPVTEPEVQKAELAPPAERLPVGQDGMSLGEVPKERTDVPHLGWLSVSPTLGSFSREVSIVDGASTFYRQGGAFAFGADAAGELWLNRNVFLSGAVGFASSTTYSQSDAAGGETLASGGTVGMLSAAAQVGYRIQASSSFFGPTGWVKAGFRTDAYSLAVNLTEKVGGFSTSGPVLSLGADLPVRGNFGLLVESDFGLLMKAKDENLELGSGSNPLSVEFFFGLYYQAQNKMRIKGGFDFQMATADFGVGTTVAQRSFAFAPTVAFYF